MMDLVRGWVRSLAVDTVVSSLLATRRAIAAVTLAGVIATAIGTLAGGLASTVAFSVAALSFGSVLWLAAFRRWTHRHRPAGTCKELRRRRA